jgi:periplasmic protein TonB
VSRALVPIVSSLVLHAGIAAIMLGLSVRRAPQPQETLQVAVVDVPPPEAPKPPHPPPPKPVPIKLARAPKAPPPPRTRTPPPQPVDAPPPPTHEAPSPAPVVVTGITLESTSQGGSFAVGVGNTLRGAPERTAREPETVKPYKAEKYAPAAQVTELPRPLNGSINLRKYYPPQALKEGFEGDVVLRLLIDSDGSVAKVDIVNDPGSGLGPAAAKMVKAEYRFSPATVNGVPVATTVPFTVHFTLN